MIRTSRKQIRELIATTRTDLPEHETDEMAVPTWLHWNPLIRWLFWKRLAAMADLARLDGTQSVLDFGCGIGMFLPTLVRDAAEVRAVDLHTQYAEAFCRQQDLDVRFIESIDEIPAGSLDVIFAADVMEHLDDPGAWARRFATLLKPGGRLIVSGPTENIAYRIGRSLAGFGDKGDYHHTNILDLERIIVESGYTCQAGRALPWRLGPRLFSITAFEAPTVSEGAP